MLHVFLGTDRKKALAALQSEVEKTKVAPVRITDASSSADLSASLLSGSMFVEKKVVVLDRVSDNEEHWTVLVDALPRMSESEDTFFVYEEKPLAAEKRLLEKYAASVRSFNLVKSSKVRPSVFALAGHLRTGDRKKLWVAYQEELARGEAPEAIHGVLFWGAKQSLLAARKGSSEHIRGAALVIRLTELPHESRRKGEELEYALERFILTNV